MAVVPVKTVPQCKLCKHPERANIDALLELRSKHTVLEDGTKVNLDYVLGQLASKFEVVNPTRENVTTHFGKHCEVASEAQTQALEKRHAEVLERFEEGERVSADEVLDFIIFHGAEDLRAKLAETGKAGISVDQILKAIDGKTRRKQDESANALLRAAAGGIQLAFNRAFGVQPEQPAIEGAAEVIEDAEVVERPA